MKTLVIRFTDGFVKILKVMKDLDNATVIKQMREEGWGNVQEIIEA